MDSFIRSYIKEKVHTGKPFTAVEQKQSIHRETVAISLAMLSHKAFGLREREPKNDLSNKTVVESRLLYGCTI